MKSNEIEKLPKCSAEISRCLDDLINMFEGNEADLAEKLMNVRTNNFIETTTILTPWRILRRMSDSTIFSIIGT